MGVKASGGVRNTQDARDMIEAGGQIAVVTARDAFTLDQDALPGLRCR